MLNNAADNINFISVSVELVSSRFEKIKSSIDFVNSPDGVLVLDSIAIRLQSIGECIKNIYKADKEFLKNYPEINWQEIIKFRDFVSHHYEEIDHELIFHICKNEIPNLKKQ